MRDGKISDNITTRRSRSVHSGFLLAVKGGSVAEWFRPLDLTSGVPWVQFSNLLLYGFVLGSPKFKLIACVNSQLVSLPLVGILNSLCFICYI